MVWYQVLLSLETIMVVDMEKQQISLHLDQRHALLAVGSSLTLVRYLWDTFECRAQ